ncbi:MAG: universal stress protein [Candidatus Aureabacteria bacterium]|nr:universal stress protein [Candidatus Auribacterota bacterium]
MKEILLFVEPTEASARAAQYAVWLAAQTGASLTAVYVVDTKTLDDLLRARIFVRMEEMDYERDLEEDGRRYLNHVRDLAEAKGVRIATALEKGGVHRIVVQKAKDIKADMVVIGEREAKRSRRDCYYDEGERILCEARCPVLVVKGAEEIKALYDSI